MSHFNLGTTSGNNSPGSRRKFIGPQHRLATRPATGSAIAANLENIGGRIMVENEMMHHKLRMREVKPSVDTTLPWAHRIQTDKLHGSTQNPSRVAQKLHAAGEADRQFFTGSRPASASANRPISASRPATRNQHAAAAHQPFDVAELPVDHQTIVRDMLRVLCSLDQGKSKHLLEHMYREAEDKKLLMSYTGVFPDDVPSTDS